MATADTLITLDDLRAEFGLPDTTHDALLTAHRAQAAAWLGAHLNRALLDETRDIERVPIRESADLPCALIDDDVRAVTACAYWGPDDARRLAAPRVIPVDDLGRRERRDGLLLIWPPADGWPARADGAGFVFTVDVGLPDASAPLARAALVAVIRVLFDGAQALRPTAALHVLTAPLRRVTPGVMA